MRGIFTALVPIIFIQWQLKAQTSPWKKFTFAEEIRDSFLLSKPNLEYAYGDVTRMPDGTFKHKHNWKIEAKDTIGRVVDAVVRIRQRDFGWAYHHLGKEIKNNGMTSVRFEFGDDNYFASMKLWISNGKYCVVFFPANPVLAAEYKKDSVVFTVLSDELILNKSKLKEGDSIAGLYRSKFVLQWRSQSLFESKPKSHSDTTILESSFRGTLRRKDER